MKRLLWRGLRVIGTVLILAVTLYWARPMAIAQRLGGLDLRWVTLGVFLCFATYWVIAARWWYIANTIGAPLSYTYAISEYLLGGFFNQALPTGLAGPVLRAVRHSKKPSGPQGQRVGRGKAFTAVVIDRLMGLVGQAIVAGLGAFALSFSYPWIGLWGGLAALGAILAMVLGYRVARNRYSGFAQSVQTVLVNRRGLLGHTVGACIAVGLLSAAFYCASQAMDVELSLWRVLCVAPLILGAMVIPLSVAGWGVREAAAAALFSALGTDAETGVAVSVTFGLMSFLSALPGLGVWLWSKKGQMETP